MDNKHITKEKNEQQQTPKGGYSLPPKDQTPSQFAKTKNG